MVMDMSLKSYLYLPISNCSNQEPTFEVFAPSFTAKHPVIKSDSEVILYRVLSSNLSKLMNGI